MVTSIRKAFLTPGYVTSGNFTSVDESDTSWSLAKTPWERLRWARRRKFASAAEAARKMTMGEHTYSAYERREDSSKHTALTFDRARQFADEFGVNWRWLLEGQGLPFDTDGQGYTPHQRRLADLIKDRDVTEQDRIVTALETLLRSGTLG